MAEAEQPQQIPEAAYPAPPPFWKQFTLANEEELKKAEALSGDEQSQQKLPLHLAYLRPPPPPSESAESYTTFGQKQIIDPTKPSSLPIDQLLFDPNEPNLNHATLLSKLTKSLLLNFLELASVLSLDPAEHEEKTADIRQLLINIHVVINIYRPHQARESVKEMLEGILQDGEREIEDCNNLKERVEVFLGDVGRLSLTDAEDITREDASIEEASDDQMDKQRNLWKMINEMT